MKKIVSLLLFTVFCLVFTLRVRAVECGDSVPSNQSELEQYIASCNSKLSDLSGQKQTLAAAISYLNTQINLTQAKIAATQVELDRLGREIDSLSGLIASLDYSLDELTVLFASRVRSTYIHRQTHLGNLVAELTGAHDFLRRLEYYQQVRDHDRELLIKLEKSRLDYDAQKSQKEAKQAEVESLKKTLDAQKASLAGQRAAKDKLLADTKNDEKRYAQLLSAAQRQLAAFSNFVSNQGGASILSGQTTCNDWGCYYNQRDSEWGNLGIGLSDSSMREYGCLVTSMAMIASHYGKGIKPGDIASASEPFFGSTAYMNQGTWTAAGVTMTRTRLGSSLSHIDSELSAGRPVIVGIYGGPDHFLVIKGKDGDNYIMHDPYVPGGHDLKFTDKYPLSAISAVDRVSVN